MQQILDLENMTVPEKISAMESLWNDLCRSSDNIKSPAWHKDILKKREQHLKNGKEKAVAWQEAKSRILKAVK